MDVQMADPDALAEALFGTDERAMRAYALARRAHAGQRDKAGAPYILHPLSVAQGVMASGDEDALVCALLHDVVEDGGVDLDEIRQEFGDAAGDAVGLLTHEEGVPYLDYVRHIAESGSAAAIRCKISDLAQNLDIARLPEAGQKDFERVEKKYLPALRILLDRLEKGVADAADE